MGDTGATGSNYFTASNGVTYPNGPIVVTRPTVPTVATVTIEPTYIMTIDQLKQYHDTSTESEATDKASMEVILQPSISGIQQNLIQWASLGFPVEHEVLSVSLIHPSPCADGQTRDILAYIQYITGSNIVQLTNSFQSNFLGIRFSYVISENNVNLHATKA